MTRAARLAIGLGLAAFVVFGFSATAAYAQGLDTGIGYGAYTGLSGADIRVTIANIIRIALGFLGILAVLIILYGGFLWMTAGGDAERIDRAKKVLTAAVIGLIIIISAFAIASFVLNSLRDATTGGPSGGGPGGGLDDTACIGLSATCPAGALGNGIVEGHYPARNATGVPRNTRVVITFKEPVDPASLILDGEDATLALIQSDDVGSTPVFDERFAARLTSSDLEIVPDEENEIFAIVQTNCPADCIGSPSENIFYTVALRGGRDGVKKADGDAAFSGTLSDGYLWEFQVSTTLDLTPPTVSFVTPEPESTGVPRNSLVQFNFSEGIDPTSMPPGIEIAAGGAPLAGETDIGNAYRSVEFRTDDLCGTNSCGEQIYCLPGLADITATAKASALAGEGPTSVFPPNGITDMAGNSLDGSGDGAAEGPPDDDFAFGFSTSGEIDLTPPVIVDQRPAILEGEIPRDLRVDATFSKLMSTTSITTDSAGLSSAPGGPPTNYMVVSEHISTTQDDPPSQTRAIFIHDLFSVDQPYSAHFTSKLRDTRQNCFFPGSGQNVCTGSEPYCCNGIPSDVECGFLE